MAGIHWGAIKGQIKTALGEAFTEPSETFTKTVHHGPRQPETPNLVDAALKKQFEQDLRLREARSADPEDSAHRDLKQAQTTLREKKIMLRKSEKSLAVATKDLEKALVPIEASKEKIVQLELGHAVALEDERRSLLDGSIPRGADPESFAPQIQAESRRLSILEEVLPEKQQALTEAQAELKEAEKQYGMAQFYVAEAALILVATRAAAVFHDSIADELNAFHEASGAVTPFHKHTVIQRIHALNSVAASSSRNGSK